MPWYRRLHWQIFVAMGAGLVAGLLGGEAVADRVGWLGTLFVRLLKMVIIPLVVTSIITGVASVGSGRNLGRLFGKTLGYYVLSSALAIFAGLAVLNLLRPGEGAQLAGVGDGALPDLQTPSSLTQLLFDMVPLNVIDAASKPDMLAVIFFCIVFGIAIAGLPEPHRPRLLGFFESAFQAMMVLTSGIIRVAPIGVFGLIARVAGTSGIEAFQALALYMLAIACGLAFHLFVTLPLLLRFLGGIDPRIHFRNMVNPLTMAFSTASSAATLPVTIRAVEEQCGVSNRVTSFVLPMGATINMDGTALYECGGVLFIAQVLGVDLSLSQQLVVVLTALLASIGAAAVPSAGLVVIFLVLESVNLRGPEVELIVGAMLAIDRPLDMFRTMVNVFSDSAGAAIIARSEGETGVDV
ncbi:MAG: dicarboxylate/amino acid:cation symporter [Myxococcales bacterium]|nr:dicarboxylate/amino acid:cation symporter [Myxococcales bacterium]